MISPHGILINLFERQLNNILLSYSLDEIIQILAIWCATENIEIKKDALAHLETKGIRTSLRYVV
jgi:DNA helicase TIP49 (TBP-interacting protein)